MYKYHFIVENAEVLDEPVKYHTGKFLYETDILPEDVPASHNAQTNNNIMRELNPSIDLQELLARQIFNVLQGSVTEIVRQECVGTGYDANFRSVLEGNSLKVSAALLPEFHALCQEVIDIPKRSNIVGIPLNFLI